jgi:alkylation response protein AidB-like acyl-CoA dehydrogenase
LLWEAEKKATPLIYFLLPEIQAMVDVFGAATPYAEPLWYSRGHSPYYGDSHRRLRQEARNYVDTYISPYVEEWERTGTIPTEVYQRHAKMGYVAQSVFPIAADCMNGVTMPGNIPIQEWDGFHDLIVIDEIARCGYLGFVWGINCGNAVGLPPVVNFGTREQRQKFIPDVMKGKTRFCLGITEPSGEF